MAQVGEGARRAESKRGLERMEEERMRRDREAQWLARVKGWAWYTEEGSLIRTYTHSLSDCSQPTYTAPCA